ncbi:hypothetical protein ACQ4PT_042487 [Festuca glaucescens]
MRHVRTPRGFVQLLAAEVPPSRSTAGQFQAASAKLGFAANVFAGTALLNLYCRSRCLREAQQLFDEMPERSGVTWSSLIYGHARSREPGLAVEAFGRMVRAGVSPTASAMSSVLVACARMEDAGVGAMLHGGALKCGVCGSSIVVGTVLVDMYAKCNDVSAARQVLEEMDEKNVATFTALVSGFALARKPLDAMVLVREMQQSGVAPNVMTYSSLLSSFASPEDLDHGRQAHCAVVKKGLERNPYVLSTLLTMYSKCGSLEGFRTVQTAVSCQDQVSLNSVISGLSSLGRGDETFHQFMVMRRNDADTDMFTFASMLKAIGNSSSLLEGRQVHALILKTGHESDVNVQNGLISMYARHGEIGESTDVFASVRAPDLVSWNSLLSGYAQHGYGHVGLVDKGLEYFNLMKTDGFLAGARQEHYACIVDLLGRAGHLRDAESLVHDMPIEPGVSVYRALLSACQIHGNLEIAIRVSARLIELYPHDSSAHVQLSKAFAGDGHWGNAAEVREAMAGKGIVKNPAWSCVEDQMQVA